MDMSQPPDPWRTDEPMTVSIKFSKNYDSGFMAFKGTPEAIKGLLNETFGLKVEGTLHKVFLAAQAVAWGALPDATPPKREPVGGDPWVQPSHDEAVATAAAELGAEVIPEDVEPEPEPSTPSEPEHEHQALINEINSMSSRGKLAMLLRDPEKKKLIQGDDHNPDVRAAFKAKGSTF